MGPDRYFFLHLQKTAGTTVLRRMKPAFADPAAIYPGPDDGPFPNSTLMVDHLLERWRARGDEIAVVTGHFPLCTTELLGGSWRTFTVLRDPVERTLSFLRYHRARTPDAAEVPFEEIYEDPVRFHGLIHNHMVKMLALRADEMTAGTMTVVAFEREHLDRAIAALEGIDVVGLQDGLDPFCDALAARFGWALGPPQFSNRTRPAEVSESLRRRIAADNALDLELWDHAQALVARRGPYPT